jgi:hypothetical protein
MKVTGEAFSFYHKRKGAEEVRYQNYPNFQAKGLLPDRTLESFILKSTDGAIPNFSGRIFQVKGQSEKVILLFSYFVLFYGLK